MRPARSFPRIYASSTALHASDVTGGNTAEGFAKSLGPWYPCIMRVRYGFYALGVLLVVGTTLGQKPHRVQAPAVKGLVATDAQQSIMRHAQAVENGNQGGSDAVNVFNSSADCERLWALGHRAPRGKEQARMATWNVRYFPDGIPGESASSTLATNVPWLACAIAWLNVDAIALEEVKSKPRSRDAMNALVQRLNELTHESYTYRIDDCPDSSSQHLAWVWNETRVSARAFRMHAAANPNGESCAGQLRPGFGVDLAFKGGLDLHAVALHLKSGTTERDRLLRHQSMDGLEAIVTAVVHESGDKDLLLLGDMNSMGCDTCDPVQRGSAEALEIDTRLRAFHVPMRRVPSDLGCSHYYQKHPALLDHFFVTDAMQEAAKNTLVEVQGYCRSQGCESIQGSAPTATLNLSDHCPIVLSLTDKDLDRE